MRETIYFIIKSKIINDYGNYKAKLTNYIMRKQNKRSNKNKKFKRWIFYILNKNS